MIHISTLYSDGGQVARPLLQYSGTHRVPRERMALSTLPFAHFPHVLLQRVHGTLQSKEPLVRASR